eukprot:XP_001692210.1 predicted protein [Chlamydomonas reinhardtii]
MVARVCKLLIKDPDHPNKVYHQWATTISPGTKPETFRGDLLPETDSTVNYKLSVDPEDPEDPVEYYSPEQVLAFALEYLASGSDGPACPLPCASWDAEKQRLTLTIDVFLLPTCLTWPNSQHYRVSLTFHGIL